MSEQQDVRPQGFAEFVGQTETINVLRTAVVAARTHGRPCGHVLLSGCAGCGKTSLAGVVAHEMGTKMHALVCTAVENRGELVAALTSLEAGDVLFLDEVHALDKALQESLYTAMEDGVVDVNAGRKVVRLKLQPFTLVAATTRAHLLTGPLRTRFAYTFALRHYKVPELALIAARAMDKLGMRSSTFHANHADAIGRRSKGTPRIAINLTRTCRDFMQAAGEQALTLDIVEQTMDALGIDSMGLDAQDRAYLQILVDAGKPVGVGAAASKMGLERGVLEGVIEPTLLENGLVMRTREGRVATPLAAKHLAQHELQARRETAFNDNFAVNYGKELS